MYSGRIMLVKKLIEKFYYLLIWVLDFGYIERESFICVGIYVRFIILILLVIVFIGKSLEIKLDDGVLNGRKEEGGFFLDMKIIIVVVVCVGFLLLIIICIVVFCIKCRCKEKKNVEGGKWGSYYELDIMCEDVFMVFKKMFYEVIVKGWDLFWVVNYDVWNKLINIFFIVIKKMYLMIY